jgi:hypothetical protein
MKEIPGYKSLGDFQFEVQIRTLSQHIWAETSRVFSYKTEESIPKPLLRSVGRISALLETVDFEIDRLIEQRAEYINQIQVNDSDDTELNVDIIEKLLNIYLGINRFKGNSHYDLILSDLMDNDIFQSSDLVSLLKNHTKYLDDSESKYLKSDHPIEIIEECKKRGFVMDYLGAIRFILRKEIQGYEPF